MKRVIWAAVPAVFTIALFGAAAVLHAADKPKQTTPTPLPAPAQTAIPAKPDSDLPPADKFLFWTPKQQIIGYRSIEKIFPTRTIKRGDHIAPLHKAAHQLNIAYNFGGANWNTKAFMSANNVSGLLIVQNGKILLERYGLGETQHDRWTSFSVAKSITSTLVGAAIKDGYIESLDTPITTYIPELKGSAYDGVTVRQVLTMTSGVKWNEDYEDPNSDVNQFAKDALNTNTTTGENPIVTYMSKLPREAEPGTKFVYKTGESDLIGILVALATHKHLADYLSEKIWAPYGMQRDAIWMIDSAGVEVGGCCISMTLRDYARFGMFFMNGGIADGKKVLPDGWVKRASSSHIASGWMNTGYGFQWWVHPDGSYEAIGVFGQSIYINPKKKLIVVTNSAWPEADADRFYTTHNAYLNAVLKAVK